LRVAPTRTAVVGDSLVDLEMGRNAGAGRVIGVLSGIGDADHLAPVADILLPSVAGLLTA
jgi:phosphoglycolate phosphatase